MLASQGDGQHVNNVVNGILVSNNMDRILDDMIGNEESYLPVLSTSAAISPLLGLFGTVWGLIHSFISISQRGSADIVTVAPGIAEALITTLIWSSWLQFLR